MLPHKKFHHFIKWFDIFIRAKTNIKKKKGKIKQKIKGKSYLAPRAKPAHPAQPAHRGRGVFFPAPRLQAARWNATEPAVDDTSPSRAFQASPCLLLAPGDALEHASSIPPSRASSPPPALEFVAARSFTGAHRRGRRDHRALELQPASPPCSSSSTSPSRRSWSPNASPSRRHRLQPLAGTASSPSSIRRR